MFRNPVATGGVVIVLLAVAVAAPAAEGVKLLSGFEKAQVLKWGYVEHEGKLITKRALDRKRFSSWIATGDATQGERAYVRRFGKNVVRWYFRSGKSPEEILYMQGTAYNTFGAFRKRFPTDWSGYDRLRIDVKSTGCPIRLRLMLEDELTSPHLTRDYQVPAAKWVTLEFDLAAAAKLHEVKLSGEAGQEAGDGKVLKARLLNLAKMANILLRVEQADKQTDVLLDNIRLLAPEAEQASKLTVLTDKRPFPIPGQLPVPAEPLAPKPAPGKRNREPVEPEKPTKAGLARGGSYGMMNLPRGVAVADNDRILFIGSIGRMQAAQSIDGGATWTNLAAKRDATTWCQHSVNAPGNGACADGEDGFVFYTARCANMGRPSDIYFRHLKFDGTGWKLGEPRLVEVDVRHCPEHKVRAVRLASGRIWVAWLHVDRFARQYLRARYSDDGGQVWRTTDSNGLLMISRRKNPKPLPLAVAWWQQEPAGWTPPAAGCSGRIPGRFHPHGRFSLIRYGKSVACIYAEGDRATSWTWFDAEKKTWSKPALVFKCFGGPVTAVSVGEKTIYTSLRRVKKIMRLDGEQWIEDTPPGYGGGGVLSLAGKVLHCFWLERKGDQTLVRMSRKPAGAKWAAPVTLATEERKLQGISAPMYAPETFVPVFWGPAKGWVRFLRVPVTQPR